MSRSRGEEQTDVTKRGEESGGEEPTAAEEAELVAQIAAGDVGAPVAELYRRYGRRLFFFGMQVFGDVGLAEEVVQECFVRLWRTAGRFDAARVVPPCNLVDHRPQRGDRHKQAPVVPPVGAG